MRISHVLGSSLTPPLYVAIVTPAKPMEASAALLSYTEVTLKISFLPCTTLNIAENGIADMEVEERRMSGHKAGTTGRADGSTGQNGHASGHALAAGRQQQQGRSTLPMLASACPGWVCYAEKTHGDTVLPFISTTRSPQVLFLVASCTFSSFRSLRMISRSHVLMSNWTSG